MKKLFILVFILILVPVYFLLAEDDDYVEYYDDLNVNSITISPVKPQVGQECIITVKIKNTGNRVLMTGAGTDTYNALFSNFEKISLLTPDISLDNQLKPGSFSSYVFEGSFNQSGSNELVFILDPADDLEEKNEDDNEKTKTIEVLPEDAEIDLKVDSIKINKEDIIKNNEVIITVTVKNEGEVSLTSAFGLMKYEKVFENFTEKEEEINDYPTTENPMDTGDTFKYIYTGSFDEAGTSTLSFVADTFNRLQEIDEDDNSNSEDFYIYKDQEEIDQFEISGVDAKFSSSSAVRIDWRTSQKSSCEVRYKQNTTGTYENFMFNNNIDKWPNTSSGEDHEVYLDKLHPNSKYVYQIFCTLKDYEVETENLYFTMPASYDLDFSVKPFTQEGETENSIIIKWETNFLTTSKLYYKKVSEENFKEVNKTDLDDNFEVLLMELDYADYDFYISATSIFDSGIVSHRAIFSITDNSVIEDDSRGEELGDEINDEKNEEEKSEEITEQEQEKGQENIINISNKTLYDSLRGKIVLKVEENGEAYYINPESQKMHFLGRPDDAFNVMRAEGIGISNDNLEKIQIGLGSLSGDDSDSDGLSDLMEDAIGSDKLSSDSDTDGYGDKEEITNGYLPGEANREYDLSTDFAKQQAGKIFLQVENNGEAWYVNPEDNKRYFLGRPADAFGIMRDLGLGISNDNFENL